MAKITRKTQKIFGGNSSNNGQYGSARAGTFILNNDPDVIQALPAWESGINAATISGAKLPALEEAQGVDYVLSRQIAYVLQEGIPEYSATTTYFIDSIVKEGGTVKLYKSIADDNLGFSLPNAAKWQLLADLDTISPLNNFAASTDPTAGDDSADGYSAGSKWYNTISQDIFLCVNATIGAAVWVDTGVNLTDLGTLAFLNDATEDEISLSDVTTNNATTLRHGFLQKLSNNTAEFLRGDGNWATPVAYKFISAPQTITPAGALVLPHSLGVNPTEFASYLTCTTADAGYPIDARVPFSLGSQVDLPSTNSGVSINSDATNLNVRFGQTLSPGTLIIINGSTGVQTGITNASWTITFIARV